MAQKESPGRTGGAQAKADASQGAGAKGEAKQQAGKLADQAKEQASSRTAEQKERATESLDHVAQALHQTGDNLRDEEQQTVARYMDDAATQVERLAGYLKEKSPEDLFHEAERFARREPAMFVGGAFALGLLGARFLKSSSPGKSSGSSGRSQRPRNSSYDAPPYQEGVPQPRSTVREYDGGTRTASATVPAGATATPRASMPEASPTYKEDQ